MRALATCRGGIADGGLEAAAELDSPFRRPRRCPTGMDDGFRVRSEVTDDGIPSTSS